jgi:hypothetical protein
LKPIHALLALGPAAALAAGAGCALLAGLDGDRFLVDAGQAGSGGATGSGGSGGAAGSPCVLAVPPAPPKVKDAGGDEEFVAAVRTMDLGESASPGIGFDLDGVCTCPGPPSCAAPSWATASHCDAEGGRDNGAGQAFGKINAAFSPASIISSVELSQRANLGSWTILVRVRGYDGGDDDDQVDVALYLTTGFSGAPAWNGGDAWPVADVSLADAMTVDQPLVHDPAAHVTGGTLVARFAAVPLLFQGAGVQLRVDLSAVTLSAHLQATDGGGRRLTGGTVAATWKLADLFTNLSGLRINGGQALCTDSAYYLLVKSALCAAADLSAAGGGVDAGCDALSFGMGFEGYPALLGSVAALPPPSGGCPMSTDPGMDVCGN